MHGLTDYVKEGLSVPIAKAAFKKMGTFISFMKFLSPC